MSIKSLLKRAIFWFMIMGGVASYACQPHRVMGLNPYGDNFLAVRSGPGTSYYAKDTLHNGERVFVCAYSGAWRRIFYGHGCYLDATGRPSGYCRSGWAYGRYLTPAYISNPGGYSGGYSSFNGPAINSSPGIKEVYYAKLGTQDHYNSRGIRLNSVAAILRQDRANYHKYFRRDPEDTADTYFANEYNRSIFEQIINRSYISPQVRNAILYGEPYIRVTIYNDGHIKVEVL